MSARPAYRLTDPQTTPTGHRAESDATMSAREMEAHAAKALQFMAMPADPGTIASAQAHATLALAWATRLGVSA